MDALVESADAIWRNLPPSDWKEAFEHHPKIGDVEALKEKFASTVTWIEGEQAGVRTAPEEVLQQLARRNQEYESKFGYIFIVCATGKSATEMLAMLDQRLGNAVDEELKIAAEEQRKITRIRLEKLLADSTPRSPSLYV